MEKTGHNEPWPEPPEPFQRRVVRSLLIADAAPLVSLAASNIAVAAQWLIQFEAATELAVVVIVLPIVVLLFSESSLYRRAVSLPATTWFRLGSLRCG